LAPRDHLAGPRRVARRRQEPVQDPCGSRAAVAGHQEQQPARRVRQIGAVVERLHAPRRREPEQERQGEAAERGDAEEEPGQSAQAHGDLGDGDQCADGHRGRHGEGTDERRQRRHGEIGLQLAADRTEAGRVQERRVRQLVEAGVQERAAKEDPDAHQGAAQPLDLPGGLIRGIPDRPDTAGAACPGHGGRRAGSRHGLMGDAGGGTRAGRRTTGNARTGSGPWAGRAAS
jgi:hypothetical protein